MALSTASRTSPRLVLASRSKARALLLRQAGVTVEIAPTGIDESIIKNETRVRGGKAEEAALGLARAKALTLSTRPDFAEAWIIGADQMLDCEGRWFDQPESRNEAAEQLAALAGRTHTLTSAAVIARTGKVLWQGAKAAHLTMRPLDPAGIGRYLERAGSEIEGTVGAYRLEGTGVHLFERIDGDYFTVLGLPLLPLLAALRSLGALAD